MTAISRRYHSQNDEERYILEAFAGSAYSVYTPEKLEAGGRFCDVGAWDAKDLSNTRALYGRGWGGVLVEPSPGPFANLEAEYGKDPRITLINAAVTSGEQAELEMFITRYPTSTSNRKLFKKLRGEVPYEGRQMVPCISMARLFAQYGPFDFLNIDTEGSSAELMIHSVLSLRRPPRCICCEYDDRIVEILKRATGLGYVCSYVSGENVVLVRA